MFTDGYVEDNIRWEVNAPTLWVINGFDGFTAPRDGRVINY